MLALVHISMILVTHYPVNSLNDILQKLSHRNFPTNVIQCLVIGTDRDMTDQQRRIHFVSACSYHIESTWDDIYIHCTWVKSDRCCHGVSWSTRDAKCISKIGYSECKLTNTRRGKKWAKRNYFCTCGNIEEQIK